MKPAKMKAPVRKRTMTEQLVIRVPLPLYEALELDAQAHGRTIAQSARWALARYLEVTDGTRR